jgi:hypothetical protein
MVAEGGILRKMKELAVSEDNFTPWIGPFSVIIQICRLP